MYNQYYTKTASYQFKVTHSQVTEVQSTSFILELSRCLEIYNNHIASQVVKYGSDNFENLDGSYI